MAVPPLWLSIDGQNGRDYAQQHDLDRLTQVNKTLEQALALPGQVNRDGRPGHQARRAVPGAPAGHITLQLSESRETYGGIRIDVHAVQPEGEVPRIVEVPVGQDIFVSAVGGEGEDGHNGGNGQPGLAGLNGTDATEVTDATPGMNGGNGGDAGHGSSGGDGGQGGTVEIIIDDTQTNLLMAFDCQLHGGMGGESGQHGQPGIGGTKGIGGLKHEWRKFLGYKYSCTNGCIAASGTPDPKSNALVRVGSVINKERAQLMARMTTQIVTGNDIVATLAAIAASRQVARRSRIDPGACKCHGGSGNCVGCKEEPLHVTLRRPAGLDGEDGMPGQPVTTSLAKGHPGGPGKFEIVLNGGDGSQRRYSSVYQLKLVDFVIRDENGDSIFEPGEHIYIQQIKVRNTGGMPSPARRIPVTFASSDSDWLVPVDGDEGHAFLPASVPPDSSAFAEGSIKVLIRERREAEMPPIGVEFSRRAEIAIKATMPWLDRELPYFEKTSHIDIQFPCRLQNFNQLATVALGSRNVIKFEVFNKGNVPIGPGIRHNPRLIEIDIAFPADYGTLKSESGEWQENVTRVVSNVLGQKTVQIQQELRIHDHATCYQHVPLDVTLLLGKPAQSGRSGPMEIVAVQEMTVSMQISDHYVYQPESSFLLVTNSHTDEARSLAIRKFIRDDLKMEVDTWNVELYGSLQYRDSNRDAASQILDAYPGKSIIFLANSFDFFNRGQRTVFDLCDPAALADVLSRGTNCIFLETSNLDAFNTLAQGSMFSPRHKVEEVDRTLLQSDRFDNVEHMVNSLIDGKAREADAHLHHAVPSRRRSFFRPSANSELKRTWKQLSKSLPSDRCIITVTEPAPTLGASGDGKASAQTVVSMGLPYYSTFAAVEPCRSTNLSSNFGEQESEIDPLEKHMITWCLPLSRRVDLLWATQPTVNKFAISSIATSLAQTVNREVVALVQSNASVPDKSAKLEDIRACMLANLPSLSTILDHTKARDPHAACNEMILFILRMALASTQPTKRRHSFSKQHSRTKELLQVRIMTFMEGKGFQADQIAQFFQEAKDIKSAYDATHTTVESLIIKDLATLVKRSEHAIRKGIRDANDIIPQTTWIEPNKWNDRVRTAKLIAESIEEDEAAAKQFLGRMLVEEPQRDL